MKEQLISAWSWFKTKFLASYRALGLPSFSELRLAILSFSPRQRLNLSLVGIIFVISFGVLLFRFNDSLVVEVAIPGGSLSEGLVGIPHFANPLLATSDADRDLVALIYSGLLRPSGNGTLIPDLAESFTVSEDGLIYTFKLKPNLHWQDGEKITTADIVFTLKRVVDPILKSPRRANWDGVTINKINDSEIQFVLKKPYASFLVNTTIGILPKHLWEKTASESFSLSNLNIEPIGSGPYQVASVQKNSAGLVNTYELVAFPDFALGLPRLETIKLSFYPNEKELLSDYSLGRIKAVGGLSPDSLKIFNQDQISRLPLPRVFGVFFNQNQARVFTNTEVRKALDLATNKQAIIDQALAGYGEILDNALPPGSPGYQANTNQNPFNLENAKKLLADKGWKPNKDGILEKKVTVKKTTTTETLTFSIYTSNAPELVKVAKLLKQQWEVLGASITIQVFEPSDLSDNFIRPRKYDALLFGEVLGRNPDLFPFWHSSQRLDPGLNIAMYTNIKADKLLEEARATSDPEQQKERYRLFQAEISKDTPAIFLYSPYYLYFLPSEIKGAIFSTITTPAERFENVYHWYRQTDQLWRFLAKPQDIINN